MSSYVLSRVLPSPVLDMEDLLVALRGADEEERRYLLAELNDLLSGLDGKEVRSLEGVRLDGLSPFLANYVAAMVELAASRHGVVPPTWTANVPPLDRPYFATPMVSLRLHLLRSSPVAFKRRNIFIDATLGDRV